MAGLTLEDVHKHFGSVVAVIIFGLIGRFGDLPKLLGAMSPEEE